MIQASIGDAWERGCYQIMLLSGLDRPEARAFHEAIGSDKHSKQAFAMYR